MANRGAAGGLRQRSLNVMPPFAPFESEFDPAELMGTIISFVDPFSFDPEDFQADSPSPPFSRNLSSLTKLRAGLSGAPLAGPAAAAYPCFQDTYSEPYHEPLLPPRVVHLAAMALHTCLEVPEIVPERTRLSADQAICIFHQRGTKTSRTAALLSAEYGITPKAIRDIWTRKSWAHETRPHWTYIDH